VESSGTVPCFSAELSALWGFSAPTTKAMAATASVGAEHLVLYHLVMEGGAGKMRVLPPFTTEIPTAALLQHLPGDTVEESLNALLALLKEAVEHALNAVPYLIITNLWDRMG
jgi:hypothetical protein